MNVLGRIAPFLSSSLQRFVPSLLPRAGMHSIMNGSLVPSSIPSPWSLTQVRTKIRCYFPRPSENKRIKRQGFWKRMSTPGGRKVLMRKILAGKHVLSH